MKDYSKWSYDLSCQSDDDLNWLINEATNILRSRHPEREEQMSLFDSDDDEAYECLDCCRSFETPGPQGSCPYCGSGDTTYLTRTMDDEYSDLFM